jgi:phosphatidylserine synthase
VAAFVYGVCAVTRLASFNVADDARTFIGVPTPAAALIWSTVLAAGPTASLTMAVFLVLGLGMVMPVVIPRPRGAALVLFGAWAVALVGWHLRGL